MPAAETINRYRNARRIVKALLLAYEASDRSAPASLLAENADATARRKANRGHEPGAATWALVVEMLLERERDCPHPLRGARLDGIWGTDTRAEPAACVTCGACGSSFDIPLRADLLQKLLAGDGLLRVYASSVLPRRDRFPYGGHEDGGALALAHGSAEVLMRHVTAGADAIALPHSARNGTASAAVRERA